MYKIVEIVESLQGEGQFTGYPTLFIRMSGCNLSCRYCDTKEACNFNKGELMDVQTIVSKITESKINHVCLTGGEPLIAPNIGKLIKAILDTHVHLTIETNGSVGLQVIKDFMTYKTLHIDMDVKCPSSNFQSSFVESNLNYLDKCDELKFVIGTGDDFEYFKKFISFYESILYTANCSIIVSPVMNKNGTLLKVNLELINEVVEYLKSQKAKKLSIYPQLKLGVQIHKFIQIY